MIYPLLETSGRFCFGVIPIGINVGRTISSLKTISFFATSTGYGISIVLSVLLINISLCQPAEELLQISNANDFLGIKMCVMYKGNF